MTDTRPRRLEDLVTALGYGNVDDLLWRINRSHVGNHSAEVGRSEATASSWSSRSLHRRKGASSRRMMDPTSRGRVLAERRVGALADVLVGVRQATASSRARIVRGERD